MKNILIEFAENRFQGWYSWLLHFEQKLEEEQYALCESFVDETLRSGYAFTAKEIQDLKTYKDLIVYRRYGIEGFLRQTMERLRILEREEQKGRLIDQHFRLGLIYQKYGAEQQQNRADPRAFLEAARAHYEQCRKLEGSDVDNRIVPHIGLLLHTLGILEDRGELHEFFVGLWRSVVKAEFSAVSEFQSKATDEADRWRLEDSERGDRRIGKT